VEEDGVAEIESTSPGRIAGAAGHKPRQIRLTLIISAGGINRPFGLALPPALQTRKAVAPNTDTVADGLAAPEQ
jgi:hypothetical protein